MEYWCVLFRIHEYANMDETMKVELEREEQQRRNRLKELEEMVQRLQSENRKLLTQVGGKTKAPTVTVESAPAPPNATKSEYAEEIINLNEVEEDDNEDEWYKMKARS